MIKKLFLMLLAIVAFTPIFGKESSTKRVAILEIVDKSEQLSYGIKLMIRSNLTEAINATTGYEGYDRVDMFSIMKEHEFQRTGMVSEADIKQLGKMTGAQYILITEAVKLDELNLCIAVKIINVESARIDKAINIQTAINATDILRSCQILSEEFLRNNIEVTYSGANRKVALLEILDRTKEMNYSNKFVIRSNIEKIIAITPGYEVYDRADISSIINEQEFQRTGLVNDADIKRMKEMTGAQYILITEVAPISSEELFLTAKILDIETAKIEKTANIQSGTSFTQLQDASISLSKDLFGWQVSIGNNSYVFTEDMTGEDLFWNAQQMESEGNISEATRLYQLSCAKGHMTSYIYLSHIKRNQKDFSNAFKYLEAFLNYSKKEYKMVSFNFFATMVKDLRGEYDNLKDGGLNAEEISHLYSNIELLKNYIKFINIKEYSSQWIWSINSLSALYCTLLNRGLSDDVQKSQEVFNWINEKALQDVARSQYHLALCYKFGWGTTKNEAKYKYWIKKSMDSGSEIATEFFKRKDKSIIHF